MYLRIVFLMVYVNFKNPVISVSVGDIVDINSNYQSIPIRGNVFNGFNGEKFIETKKRDINVDHSFINKKICMDYDFLKQYTFSPIISLNNRKSYVSQLISNSELKYTDFCIDKNYVNNAYAFSVDELCLVEEEKQLEINIFDENDITAMYPKFTGEIFYNKTGVLKFSTNNMTHYVSSITTGECLYQVFVHTAEMCNILVQNNTSSVVENLFFISSIYRSRILVASGNKTLEKEINDYEESCFVANSSQSESSLITKERLLDAARRKNLIRIDLHKLPKLPDLLIDNLKSRSVSYKFLKPGNIISIDPNKVNYLFNSGGISQQEYKMPPVLFQEYTNCYENETELLTLETSDLKETKKPESYFKLSIFHQMIKIYNYGVDKEYLNDKYKCLKTTLCSELKGQKSDSPNFRIINLAQFLDDRRNNIFENENIAMIYRKNTTTYHVRSIELGDCLFQALMYDASATRYEVDYFHAFPVQRGRIMSASGDKLLENRVKVFLASNRLNPFESLSYAKFDDLDVTLPLINTLNSNKVVVNIYLNKID